MYREMWAVTSSTHGEDCDECGEVAAIAINIADGSGSDHASYENNAHAATVYRAESIIMSDPEGDDE